MPDEIRYSTRPDGRTLSRATSDTRDRTLVVLRADQLSTSSPEALQRISLASRLPVSAIRRATASRRPLVLGRYVSVGDARKAAQTFASQQAIQAEVVDDDLQVSGAAGSVLAVATGALSLLVGVATLLVVGLTFAALFFAAGAALVALGVFLRSRAAPTTEGRDALEADAELRSQVRIDERAMNAILAVREASLRDDVPVEAQVEAWRQLEAVEDGLARGQLTTDQVEPALLTAAARLGATGQAGGDDPLSGLDRISAAAERARQELGSLQ
jgi:hypothetical protein